MLDWIFSELVDAAIGSVFRLAFRPAPTTARVGPTALQRRSLRADYRLWARRLAMTADEGGRHYRGRLGRHPVVVRVALEEGSPCGVALEMQIAHAIEPVTLHASAEGRTPIEKALVALCRGPARATSLRSVAIVAEGVRFRFAALVSPEVVESCVHDAAAVIELSTTPYAYR